MAFLKQLFYVIKQELRSASRSRYIVISFIFLPIFMWGLQGGIQLLAGNTITSTTSNLTIYVTNEDPNNVTIVQDFTLPFNFDGYTAGTNITTNTSLHLSKYLVEYIKFTADYNNYSLIYHAKIIDKVPISTLQGLKDKGKVDYWIDINSSFSNLYNTYGISAINLQYLQKTIVGPAPVQLAVNQILSRNPFSVVEVKKHAALYSSEIFLPGESSNSNQTYAIGFAGFIGILLAVLIPAPFVSTSIAGEREKKTLESLLALPISRNGILMGKLLAGMVLVGVMSLVNIIGMELYVRMTSEIEINAESPLAFDITPTTIIAITLAMSLSAFIAIGLGISIVSFAKDVRTSESLYQFVLMVPAMLVGLGTMLIGVPENMGGAALLLYIIPFTHSAAIFQKMLRPTYYNENSLLGYGVVGDLTFHLAYLIVTILLVLFIASKAFDREGIIN